MIPVSGETKEAKGQAQHSASSPDPGLYIVSTPIGNMRDITLRALDILSGVEEILAEDTRTARKLLTAHGIAGKLTAYHDHNGAARRPELLDRLTDGAALALISDAGTPLVSDPGWKLAKEAVEAGIQIVPIPGPSAVLAGLVTSGLPSDRFMFAGFLPAKSGARRRSLEEVSDTPATLIFYESAGRLSSSLADMAKVFGETRPAALARELTKLFEETRRGSLGELATFYTENGAPKGEIVVLVGPPEETGPPSEDLLDAALLEALEHQPTKAAANSVAAQFGLPKRDVYQRALALKTGADG